jgi:uncharacterized protein YtpQ (UPF0354 family)
MAVNPTAAIAYLKAEIPGDDPAPVVTLDGESSPILKKLAGGLLVAYLIDEGNRFSYVQGRDLRAAGVDAEQLHAHAVANLAKVAAGRVTIRQNGPTWAVFFDGNFEASLILLDQLWDKSLREHHHGMPAVAIPARDILCFCDSSSADGIAELRAVIGRIWPRGDHLISNQIFQRQGGRWVPHEVLS